MKVKTSELIDAALDWAVAQCESVSVEGKGILRTNLGNLENENDWVAYSPSRIWSQGGPIIERGCVTIGGFNPGVLTWNAHQEGMYFMENCPTPLIAAMRCYVASKLGDEIDIPDELI